LKDCSFNVELSIPPDNYFPDDGQPYSKKGKASPLRSAPLFLSIDSEGNAFLPYSRDVRFKMEEIERPRDFFRDRMLACAPEVQ